MKKRILSLLLAVVMVVTALPLFILPALAAEDGVTYPSTTKDEYNALYVQGGLAYAVDYFFANRYWGEAEANPMPVPPYQLPEYDTEEERTPDGALNANYTNAVSTYYSGAAGHSLRLWNQALAWNRSTSINVWNSRVNTLTVANAVKDATPAFYLADGYIQFIRALSSNTYLNYTGAPLTAAGTVTAQYVMAPAGSGNFEYPGAFEGQYARDYWILYRGISLKIDVNDDDTFKLVNSTYNGAKYTLPTTAVPFSKTDVATFTIHSTIPEDTAVKGSIKVSYNQDVLMESELTVGTTKNTMFNFNNSTTASLYALRYYSRDLTEAEMAQNHFADLAKWFRLDISSYNEYKVLLSDAQMAEAYAAFAGFNFESDRAAVQAAADAAFASAMFDDAYFADFESLVDAHSLAVAKKFKLNINVFKMAPAAMMKNAVAFLLSCDLADDTLTKETVVAGFNAAVEADVWSADTNESILAAADYNALYEQTGLLVQYDFFDSNEYWGGSYSDGTRLTASGANVFNSGDDVLDDYAIKRPDIDNFRTAFLRQNGVSSGYPSVGNGYLAFNAQPSIGWYTSGYGFYGRGTSYAYMMDTELLDDAGNFALSVQTVTAYSTINTANGNPQMYLGQMGTWFTQNEDGGYYLSKVTEGSSKGNTVTFDNGTAQSFELGETVDYTQVVSQPAGDTAQAGLYAAYLNGATVYNNDAFPYTVTAAARPTAYHMIWNGRYVGNTYAVRLYNTAISAEDIAKNHFADVAKWYKLGLADFNEFTDSEKARVYEAFADIRVDDARYTRTEVQAAYLGIRYEILREKYQPLLSAHADKADFINLIADYGLSIDTLEAILTSDRDMSYVYANITAETLSGAADAEALFEKAYNDAYKYHSYSDGTNDAFLAKAAELGLDISEAMSLPKSERAPIYALDLSALSQATLDAATAAAMEKYAAYDSSMTAADYNLLYDRNGLVLQYDFFSSNQYWGGAYSDGTRLVMEDTAIHSDTASLSPFVVYSNSKGSSAAATKLGINGMGNPAGDATAQKTYTDRYSLRPTVGDGYMLIRQGYVGDNCGLGSWGRGGAYKYMMDVDFIDAANTFTFTVQYVSAFNTIDSATRPQTILGGVGLWMASDDNGNFYLNKIIESYAGSALGDINQNADNFKFAPGQVIDLTTVVSQPTDAADTTVAQPGTYAAYINGEAAFYSNSVAFTTAAVKRPVGYHMLWSGRYSGQAYAVRFYNVELSAETIAQNHFADVAKWYRLNLLGFDTLSNTEKATVYAAFADISVDDSRYTRVEVQAILNELMFDYIWADYVNTSDAAYTELLGIAAAGSVAPELVSAIVAFPAAIRNEIIAAINEEFNASGDLNTAVLSYHFENTPNVVLEERYAAYKGEATFTQEQYNELYAQKEHMVVWFDFFSSTTDLNSTIDVNADSDGTTVTIDSALAPNVFRQGKMQLLHAGGTTEQQRSLENGYFVMKAANNFPNIGTVLNDNYTESSVNRYNDYTYEILVSDLVNYNQNFQVDGVRLSFGNNSGSFRIGAATTNDYVFNGTQSAVSASSFRGPTAGKTKGSHNYGMGSVAFGYTVTLRYDKDFSEGAMVFYKAVKDDSGYTEANRTEITRAEAETLLGLTGAAFEEAMALPTSTNKYSNFVTATDGTTVVYAYFYEAAVEFDVLVNGNTHIEKTASHYSSAFYSDSIGSGTAMNVYSLRRYDIILTDEEIAQNHFVDLCKYYGLDITAYLKLDDAGRAAVHTAMKSYKIKDETNKEAMLAAYDAALTTAYYEQLKIAGETAYNAFIDSAAANGLDLSALLALPENIRLSIGDAAGIDMLDAGYEAFIARGLYADIVDELATEAVRQAQGLISFAGYSVRISGSYDAGQDAIAGIRSSFVIDTALLEQLIADGVDVSFGAVVTNPANNRFNQIVVYDNGQGANTVGGFTFAGKAYEKDGDLRFTYTTEYNAIGGTAWANLPFATRKAVIGMELIYSYFVEIDGVKYEFACESPTFGETVSAAEVYDYFRQVAEFSADGVIGDIISTDLGTDADATLYNMTLQGVALADMTLLYNNAWTQAEAEAVADALYGLTGVKLAVVSEGVANSTAYRNDLTEAELSKIFYLGGNSMSVTFSGVADHQFVLAQRNYCFTVWVKNPADKALLPEALAAQLLTYAEGDVIDITIGNVIPFAAE